MCSFLSLTEKSKNLEMFARWRKGARVVGIQGFSLEGCILVLSLKQSYLTCDPSMPVLSVHEFMNVCSLMSALRVY